MMELLVTMVIIAGLATLAFPATDRLLHRFSDLLTILPVLNTRTGS